MGCKKCAKCCQRGPCVIPRQIKETVEDKFKFRKDERIPFRWRPLFNTKGICKYLTKVGDNYSCPVIEHSEEFRKWMSTGVCALNHFL